MGTVERSRDKLVDSEACLTKHSKEVMKAWTKKKLSVRKDNEARQQKGIIQRKGGMLE